MLRNLIATLVLCCVLHDFVRGFGQDFSADQQACANRFPKCEQRKKELAKTWEWRCKDKWSFWRRECKKSCGLCGGDSTKSNTGSTLPPPGGNSNISPVKCTSGNKGHCDCGDVSKGFQTYVFKIKGVTRCFTIYRDLSFKGPVPVMLSSQCYAKDKLDRQNMKSLFTDQNKNAKRYGYARIALSTPDGNWKFGNDGVVNDKSPMPCADKDSKDIIYMKSIFKFIESQPTNFDTTRIWAEGFSQNSMFSAYIGFCFSDKVLGVWQGGSGMALTALPPVLPQAESKCRASDFKKLKKRCTTATPCKECKYWPIYPCYKKTRPVIDCLVDYTNDPIASDRKDPLNHSTALYMYNRLVNEGHDGRLFRFQAPKDQSIRGGHSPPQNQYHWQVGCLGITKPCSKTCEASFRQCTQSKTKPSSSGRDKALAFRQCIEETRFASLSGCTKSCAPTLSMMLESENPFVSKYKHFGAPTSYGNRSKPSTSKCEM